MQYKNTPYRDEEYDWQQFAVRHVTPPKPREGLVIVADGSNWKPGPEGGLYYYWNAAWTFVPSSQKATYNSSGGFMVKLVNDTGGTSVKGTVVKVSTAVSNAVSKIVVDVPDPIGVIWEDGVANGALVWVVISGIADVYFIGNTTSGHLARGFISSDAGYVSGQALSEAVPTSPFATDKHFYEIGHVLESRTGAGLAKCLLHFN